MPTVGWMNKRGEPSISLSSPDEKTAGRAPFDVSLHPDDAVCALCAPVERGPSRFSCEPERWSAIRCLNGAGKPVVTIAARKDGGGWVDVADGAGKPAVSIEPVEGGGGGITVSNTFGTAVVEVQANKRNEGAVYVKDVGGNVGNAMTPR